MIILCSMVSVYAATVLCCSIFAVWIHNCSIFAADFIWTMLQLEAYTANAVYASGAAYLKHICSIIYIFETYCRVQHILHFAAYLYCIYAAVYFQHTDWMGMLHFCVLKHMLHWSICCIEAYANLHICSILAA